MKEESPIFEKMNYETFAKTGDIYGLFYEKGNKILKKGGILGFITSNKRMRAGYGESLRKYLSEQTNPVKLIDFTGYKIFRDATVDVNILVFKHEKNKNKLKACKIDKGFNMNMDLEKYCRSKFLEMKDLNSDVWSILTPIELSIKKKVEEKGIPLKDWDVDIYRGVLTGYNDAFIVDEKTKNELIAEDPKSAEIIKPILRGRDIGRYEMNFANLYLIGTFPALNLDINNYFVIKKYLEKFLPKLKQTGETFINKETKKQEKTRKKTNNKWFETQDQIGYYKEFEKEKIIYGQFMQGTYYLDNGGNYLSSNEYMMVSQKINLKYLIGILNSKLSYSYLQLVASSLGGNTSISQKSVILTLPIPEVDEKTQKEVISLVEQIIEAKKKLSEAEFDDDKKVLKKQIEIIDKKIDKIVFDLYGLNKEEKKVVLGL